MFVNIRVLRIRNPVFFTPVSGYGISYVQISYIGSWIPSPYFWKLSYNFMGKKYILCSSIDKIFFWSCLKNFFLEFCDICGYKKGRTTNPPSPLLLLLDPGSGMEKIRIQDPEETSRIRNTEIYCYPSGSLWLTKGWRTIARVGNKISWQYL